jgi:nitrite reductase (NO-forming)
MTPIEIDQQAPPRPGRRCTPRRIDPQGPRPSDLLTTFFGAGLLMLAASAVAVVADAAGADPRLHWLALHLALLGGVSQLVLGAGQFFVCAFLATTPPSRRLVGAQLAIWNVGTVAVAVGVPLEVQALVDGGAVLVAAGLVLYLGSLRAMQQRSLQQARWAVRWYQASASCLVVGVLVGAVLAGGLVWTHGSLLGAHLSLNIAGWLGTAIIGTLHTFFPSLTGTQLRFGRLQGPTFALWVLGVVELTLAAAFAVDVLAVLAWLQLSAAGLLLAINLLASLHARSTPLSLPTRLVGLGQAFLPAGLVLALVATIADGAAGPLALDVRPALAILLVAGWIALTVAGSLMHLLTVLARVRRFTLAMPAPHPARDAAVTALAGLAVVVWALAQIPGADGLEVPALVLRILAAAVLAAHVARAAARSFRRRPAAPHPRRSVSSTPAGSR